MLKEWFSHEFQYHQLKEMTPLQSGASEIEMFQVTSVKWMKLEKDSRGDKIPLSIYNQFFNISVMPSSDCRFSVEVPVVSLLKSCSTCKVGFSFCYNEKIEFCIFAVYWLIIYLIIAALLYKHVSNSDHSGTEDEIRA